MAGESGRIFLRFCGGVRQRFGKSDLKLNSKVGILKFCGCQKEGRGGGGGGGEGGREEGGGGADWVRVGATLEFQL